MKKIISILLVILMSSCSASRMQTVQRTTITQNENGITETVETAPSDTEIMNTVFKGLAAAGLVTLGIAAALGKIH